MKIKQLKKNLLLALFALVITAAVSLASYAAEKTTIVPATKPVTAPETSEGTPKMAFEKTEHDFGNLDKNQNIKCLFKFKNEGNALLVVNNVKATCGCTGTLLSQKEIPPGGEGTIEVTFRAGSSGGKTTKSIYVSSNDPEQPKAQLQIKANVIIPVEVKPHSMNWAIEKDKASTRSVALLYQPDINVNILDISFSSPEFSASTTPRPAGAEVPGYNIEITCDGKLASGRFTEKLTITTDNPDYSTLNVTMRGNVVGAVRVIPNAVALGTIKDNVIPTRILRVQAAGKDDFEITGIESSSPIISVETTKEKNLNRYSIKITLIESPPRGAFSEKLTISTNVPEESIIDVPVYAYVR